MIKFWSYKREYEKNKNFLLKKIDSTLRKGNIFFGNELKTLEKNFIKENKAKYGVAVGSGTDALLVSLKTLNLKKGDEVITAANTAIPTISAIMNAGGKPKLVDIGEDYLIDVKKIEKAISKKTKAIIPVHLYGQMCDMHTILKIAKKRKLIVIEDCAQSQGAKFKNSYSGTLGKFGCFSFYPTKILGAYGDGGFITTNDFNLYKKIKRIRFYGIETVENSKFKNKYYSNENGLNSRLDEIQSSILNFKLKKTKYYIKRRRQIAKIYMRELSDTPLKLPKENLNCFHVYHLFTVYHAKSNLIKKKLKSFNVETRTIYPYPIQKMKAYSKLITNKKDLSNSEKKSKNIFCLPLYPELTNKEVKKICFILKKIVNKI